AAAADIGDRRLDQRAVANPHLIDRGVAEIADIEDRPGKAIVEARRRRLARDADLFRPHRGPDHLARLGVDLGGGAHAAGRRVLDALTILAEAAFEQVN